MLQFKFFGSVNIDRTLIAIPTATTMVIYHRVLLQSFRVLRPLAVQVKRGRKLPRSREQLSRGQSPRFLVKVRLFRYCSVLVLTNSESRELFLWRRDGSFFITLLHSWVQQSTVLLLIKMEKETLFLSTSSRTCSEPSVNRGSIYTASFSPLITCNKIRGSKSDELSNIETDEGNSVCVCSRTVLGYKKTDPEACNYFTFLRNHLIWKCSEKSRTWIEEAYQNFQRKKWGKEWKMDILVLFRIFDKLRGVKNIYFEGCIYSTKKMLLYLFFSFAYLNWAKEFE